MYRTADAADNIMSEQANESGENVSVIQALTTRAQDLGRSIDNWNTAYIVLVALTVVLAAGVFIAQFVTIRKSKLLASAQADLMAEKDRQSAADSKDKDLKIAAAIEAAGIANEKAGESNRKAATLEVKALSLQRELLQQGPRMNLLRGDIRQGLIDDLKPFAGQKIDVRYGLNQYQGRTTIEPDSADTYDLAATLIGILKDAGWVPTPIPLRDTMQGNGIAVEVNRKAPPSTLRAADALVKAIRNVPLVVSEPLKFPDFVQQRMETPILGKGGSIPPVDESTIVLVVLMHPA